MATDYKSLAQENKRHYGEGKEHLRIYRQLYSDKTHFVSELIQNADDSKSRHLELSLYSNALSVWNDGRQFTEEDVRNICSLGLSNKDLTQIGTFGIGFKAVYNYTDCPEIYSGTERFLIRDFIKPEGIDVDKITPKIAAQLNEGRTVFQLPFKESLRPEDIERLKNRLQDIDKRSLLFLRHLERIHWYDASTQQEGFYSCQRSPYDKIQGASYVKLQTSVDGDNQAAETFLVFRKEVHPPQYVIDELLHQAEGKEVDRIQRSAENLQPIEVAFKLDDGRITALNNCVLFAYLPTEIKTDLRFIIQARYQTTPARDNILKPSENRWNRWLMQETTNFLPEILEQLKAAKLLKPAFFNLIPLKGEVENEFKPIAEALQQVMRDRPFVPTQNGGYAKADSVFYPHNELLRELFVQTCWLHPDIRRDVEEFRRCYTVMREAGVREIVVGGVLNALEEQDKRWFEAGSDKWLHTLYVYLSRQESELERIKKLPLVRLENGRHVCASSESVFFPPHETEMREEIAQNFPEVPILQSSLLTGDTNRRTEIFLKNIGVKTLQREDLIREICSKYQSDKWPSIEQNRSHVRCLFDFFLKTSGAALENLKEEISKTPILLVYKEDQRETLYFQAPCWTYLSQAYTGNADLETYFSGCDNVWYVDDGYLDGNIDRKSWLLFLKWIGAMDTPRRILRENVPVNATELSKRALKEQYSSRNPTIEDIDLDGLSETLSKITSHGERALSLALWHLLIKVLPSAEGQRDAFFQGTYRWFYYTEQSMPFDAAFYRQLKDTAWFLDEQGNFRLPSECFAPTAENRNVLGDSVVYLPPYIDVSRDNETARWLAGKLGIHLNANTQSVLNYLQTLSGTEVSMERVEPLYHFLERQHASRSEEFKQSPLIFTPEPEPRWWRAGEVFWADESVVFDKDRGYLSTHYPETLKPFFIGLGVSERAAPLDYVRGIQEIAAVGQAENSEVRKRVNILYGRLWQALQEGGDWQTTEEWNRTRESRCWLGKKGNKWGFFSRSELVWNDHNYIADIFEGEIPFWGVDDLLELARRLEIEGCSQAKIEFHPDGDQEEDTSWSEKVQKLRPYLQAFLNSPRLCDVQGEGKSADILELLSVRLVEALKTTYTLKGKCLADPNPRQSFLDTNGQRTTLWLALEAEEDEYAWLIGDALQTYFGDVKELSGFIEDLLTKKQETVLSRWRQKGLQFVKSVEEDSKEGEESIAAPDNGTLAETSIGDANSITENPSTQFSGKPSGSETPPANERPEGSSGDVNPGTGISEPRGHPGRTRGKSPSTGSPQSRPISGNRVDTHSGRIVPDRDRWPEETEISSEAKREIERIGMETARRYEEEQGRTVKDVSAEYLGYDLRSIEGDKIRYIEVKARAGHAFVVLTSNEWTTAQEHNDDYFLYVILNAATQPELYIIQNPANKVSTVPDVRHQVKLEEIQKHGEFVTI